MSLVSFTNNICKNENMINNRLVDHFEEHFAMYSISNIKKLSNIEIDGSDYIIKATAKKCDEIANTLLSYQCSNFDTTLIPIVTPISGGLKINFKIKE